MLNHWTGMGRLTKDPELKRTPNGNEVVSFSIAVARDIKGQNGERQADFINIVAWRNTAKFVCDYFRKGNMICIEGSIQTRAYTTQSGENRQVTEVVASSVHFTGEKKESANTATQTPAQNFSEIQDDDDLPF